MAGTRLTLKKLSKKYGLNLKGLTYRKVIQEIITDNVRRAEMSAMSISERRYKKALEPAFKSGELKFPKYAVPDVTLRKSAEQGRIITDTLRDRLTGSLRKILTDNPDPVKAINEMAKSVNILMIPYAQGKGVNPPSNVHTIAVTEVRSALDLAKWEYAKQFSLVNTEHVALSKVWRHHSNLVSKPRPGHLTMNGREVGFYDSFDVPTEYGIERMMHPHDPMAPAEEVIGCQCSYDVLVKPLKAKIEKDAKKKVAIGEKVTRPDGSVWVKTGTYSYAKVDSAEAVSPEKTEPKTDEPDYSKMSLGEKDALITEDPMYKEYFASSSSDEAKLRLELKKKLGEKYKVDPYRIVDLKREAKEAEARAEAKVIADGRKRIILSGEMSAGDLTTEEIVTYVDYDIRHDAKERIGEDFGAEDFKKYLAESCVWDAGKKEFIYKPGYPKPIEEIDFTKSDLSGVDKSTLFKVLERDSLTEELYATLGKDFSFTEDVDGLRDFLSERYVLEPMPKESEATTPASKRLLDLYRSNPEARLKMKPAPISAGSEVHRTFDSRSHWTPSFSEKISKVLTKQVPSKSLKELAKSEHVKRVFVSSAKAEKFVSEIENFINTNPITQRFHINDVAKFWAEEPRTKNLFETGKGHGSTDKRIRASWEHRIIDYSDRESGGDLHKDIKPAERPSYSMIGAPGSFYSGAGSGYGESTLILKDKVKDRTTFTLGNSSGEPGAFMAGSVHKILDKDRSSSLGTNSRNKERCVGSGSGGPTYLEAQVWGGIDLRHDVSHIVISGREWERSSEGNRQAMMKVADTCGIELRYRDGEVLYTPDKSKLDSSVTAPTAKEKARDEKITKALKVPVGTIKKEPHPFGGDVYKKKTTPYTWMLCDSEGKLRDPKISTTAPSKSAVTWSTVPAEKMVSDLAPKGDKDTIKVGGKSYIKHDSSIPVGGTEERSDGTRYVRTSKFTWRKE